jgi:hypothetical protein
MLINLRLRNLERTPRCAEPEGTYGRSHQHDNLGLLFGVTWSFLYDIIFQLQPMAFSLNGAASALAAQDRRLFTAHHNG